MSLSWFGLDYGIGIGADDSFGGRFAQTKLGLSQAGKGSGLGLAIARQIVTLSGGRLGVQSRKNG